MRKKNYFYKINPSEVMSIVGFEDDRETWFIQFFRDLENDDPESAKIELARRIIEEAHGFRELRSKAGKASAKQKATRVQQKSTCVQQSSTNSSSSSSKDLKHIVQNEFELFWEAFSDKRGRAKAIESWKKIKGYNSDLAKKIIEGAKRYAEIRPEMIRKGQTPKMAQGWLTDRRWEDDHQLQLKPQTTRYNFNS